MLRSNITVADFSGGVTRITTAKRWQYDYGQLLSFSGIELPPTFECQFSNIERGEAITQIGSNNTVTIPDAMFLRGAHIYAWVFLHTGENDGETEYMAVIPIMKRAQPSDTPPTPVEQSVITQAIAALNAAVDQTGADVIAAEAAQAAAELAQEKAEDAKTAAETAQGKAEEAQTAAEAAATGVESDALKAEGYAVGQQNGSDVGSGSPYYHNNAKYYNEQAASSATAASDAQTAAETAQGKAEDAQAAAESAATGLEGDALKAEGFALGQQNGSDVGFGSPYYHNNAKYYNEQAASSATAASDAQVAAEAAQRRAEGALNEKADIIITSASGSIASFADGAALPIVDLIAAIDPIQDLHGYDSPWPAGGGVNKYDKSADYYGQSKFWNSETGALITNNDYYGSPKIPITPNTQYSRTAGTSANIFYDSNGDYLSTTFTGGTFTSPANAYYVTFNIANNVNHDTVQVEQGASLSAYSPYSNICPISGRTGLSVYRTGKNLFDESVFANYGGVLQADGMWLFNNLSTLLSQVIYTPPIGYTGQLTIVFMRKTEEGKQSLRFYINYTDGTKERIGASFATGGMDVYTLTTGASKVVKNITGDYGTNIATYVNLMVSIQGTATTYEPYTGNTYAVDWTTEAGTVYGGTLDVVTGVLTVSWACASRQLSTFNLVETKTNTKHYRYLNNFFGSSLPADSESGNLCNIAPNAYNSMDATHFYPVKSNGRIELWVPVDLSTDTEVQIAAPIATPLTYQLTPTQVSVLTGTNNIWANSGDVSVSYRADTKLYIDNKIAQAIAAALNA